MYLGLEMHLKPCCAVVTYLGYVVPVAAEWAPLNDKWGRRRDVVVGWGCEVATKCRATWQPSEGSETAVHCRGVDMACCREGGGGVDMASQGGWCGDVASP
jgi:hypothetical protein